MSETPRSSASGSGILQGLPGWLWLAFALGLALRLYLVLFTGGTLDVYVWDSHAETLNLRSMVSYYHGGTFRFNHPPPSGFFFANTWALGKATGIPFAVLLRLPLVLFDVGCLILILRLLADDPRRYGLAALYWLHPLAIIFSGYHGNTDPAVAFFTLTALLFVTRNRALAAGAVLGLSLWIKLPGILAAAGLGFALPTWRQRIQFGLVIGAVGIAGYVPILIEDWSSVVNAVILYSGEVIRTESGISAWGLQNLLPAPSRLPTGSSRLVYLDFVDFLFKHNTAVIVVPIALLAWCRRRETSVQGLATTVAASFTLLYGLSSYWAFQYFAWSVPFWILGNRRFGVLASLFATAYIYALYAWLCGDPFLYGSWDFLGKPDWPPWLTTLRDATNGFFLLAGLTFVALSLRNEITHLRNSHHASKEAGSAP